MPEISRFFGIIVAMFYSDHPPPHFHVRYGRERAVIEIIRERFGEHLEHGGGQKLWFEHGGEPEAAS